MCAVSMVGDFYKDKWTKQIQPYESGVAPLPQAITQYVSTISRAEFEALRKEVLEMKELLKRAIAYDEKTSQPHCETEDKIALLRKVAEAVGVDLKDILP